MAKKVSKKNIEKAVKFLLDSCNLEKKQETERELQIKRDQTKYRMLYERNPFELVFFAIQNKIITEKNLPRESDFYDGRYNDPIKTLVLSLISQSNEKQLNILLNHPAILYRKDFVTNLLRNENLTDALVLKTLLLIKESYNRGIIIFPLYRHYLVANIYRAGQIKDPAIIEKMSKHAYMYMHVLANEFADKKLKRTVFDQAVELLSRNRITKYDFAHFMLAPMAKQITSKEILSLLARFPKIGLHMTNSGWVSYGKDVGRQIWKLHKNKLWKNIAHCRWIPGDVARQAWKMTKQKSKPDLYVAGNFAQLENAPLSLLRELWDTFKDEEHTSLDREILRNKNCDEILATEIVMFAYTRKKVSDMDLWQAADHMPRRKYNALIKGLEGARALTA